jgi:hypothetical protein
VGTEDLLRQVEALLIMHEDQKQDKKAQSVRRKAS